MTENQEKKAVHLPLTRALEKIVIAETYLKAAAKLLADEFGNNVPLLSAKAIEIFCECINRLDFNIQFLKSFIRVSVLTQIVKPTADDSKKRDES